MAHTYNHLYKLPTTGLRFLPSVVMGNLIWHYLNLQGIILGEPIEVFNYGKTKRLYIYR